MTLRRRLTLASAAIVAAALSLVSILVYLTVRAELGRQVDGSLRDRLGPQGVLVQAPIGASAALPNLPNLQRIRVQMPPLGGSVAYVQLVNRTGKRALVPGEKVRLPVDQRTLAIAAGGGSPFLRTQRVAGHDLRIITGAFAPGVAIQVARSLDEQNGLLRELALVLIGLTVGGSALAAAFGPLAARAVLRPVRRLSEAVEHVTETRDLRRRIDTSQRDEIGRLATSFNTMLSALEASIGAQRRLVADASHELRTPLTSARTNVEVLARSPDLPARERAHALTRVSAQLEELSTIVADVVELARGAEPDLAVEDVRLDELVAGSIDRTRRHLPGARVRAALAPCLVRASPGRLERAIDNVLDNASKWSPPGSEIEVELADGELRVRDRGPGIPESDLPFVFDRFYRSPAARERPGSGLGLAIVRQVVAEAGGTATAETPPDGGTLIRLRLPLLPA